MRDDIDLLPLELPQNDFFTDIETLSPAVEYNFNRKQNKLFDTQDHLYIANFSLRHETILMKMMQMMQNTINYIQIKMHWLLTKLRRSITANLILEQVSE